MRHLPSAARLVASLLIAGVALHAQAQKVPEAWEHLEKAEFKSAYRAALGPKASTAWLAKRNGPAPPPSYEQVAGERYVMNSFCKDHDCADNSAVILYSPEKKLIYGTVFEKGKTTLIGAPPPPVAAELARLWKKEWRSQPK